MVIRTLPVALVTVSVIAACGISTPNANQTTVRSPEPTPSAPAMVGLVGDQTSLAVTDTDAADLTGKSVPGATVTATGLGVTSAMTAADAGGHFSVHVSGLKVGSTTVTLTATLAGFQENTFTVTITRTESEGAYKATAQKLPYPQLIKDPGSLQGTLVTYKAQVFQYDSRTSTAHMIASVTADGYGFWSDNVWLDMNPTIAANITQKDVVEFWGEVVGPYSYQTAMGGQNTIPEIRVLYMDLVSKGS